VVKWGKLKAPLCYSFPAGNNGWSSDNLTLGRLGMMGYGGA